MAIYTGAKALSRWPINDESTLTSTRGNSFAQKTKPTTMKRLLMGILP
jgi:hypothetical protein